MKKILLLDAPKIILWCFIVAILYLLLYELYLTNIFYSTLTFKIGIIVSKIMYSILPTSVFYFFSQYIPIYLPRQKKKIKVLFNVYHRTLIFDQYIHNLEINLNTSREEVRKKRNLLDKLEKLNPDNPIQQFQNWDEYLFYLKNNLLDIIRSITFYNDYYSKEVLHELIILEKHLLSLYSFNGFKMLKSDNLSYAFIEISELIVHNDILKKIIEQEFKKYHVKFKEDGIEYINKHYSEPLED